MSDNFLNTMHRASAAKKLLDDPVVALAFKDIEDSIVSRWVSETDSLQREQRHAELLAVHRLHRQLQEYSVMGRLAAEAQERERKENPSGGRSSVSGPVPVA